VTTNGTPAPLCTFRPLAALRSRQKTPAARDPHRPTAQGPSCRIPRQRHAVANEFLCGIDPRVIDLYRDGHTIAAVLGDLGKDSDFGDLATKGRAETALLNLLKATGPAVAVADQARDAAIR
jgi:hypothetical protein